MNYFRDIFSGDIILSDELPANPVAGGFVLEVHPESTEQFIQSLRLSETSYSKKDLMSKMAHYLTNLKNHVSITTPERLADFMAKTSAWTKEVLGAYDDYRYFIGSGGFNNDQMVILGRADEEGPMMRFFYFKDGLRAEAAVPGVNPWAEYDAAIAESEASYSEESEE
jgi:hypothetical protein